MRDFFGLAGVLVVLLGVTAGAAPLAGQSAEEVAQASAEVRAAVAARQAGDDSSFVEHMAAALALRPGHPGLIYNLAAGRALVGDTARALAGLSTVARMGLALPAWRDDDFAALGELPAFQEVVAALRRNGEPVGSAEPAFTVAGQSTMLAEGIAWDPRDGAFYISGVHSGEILRVRAADGAMGGASGARAAGTGGAPAGDIVVETFVGRSPDTWGFMGLVIDAKRRRLWAGTAAMPQFEGLDPDDEGRSAVVVYDLDTGERLGYHAPPDDAPHALGDLAVGLSGALYASDGAGGAVYQLSDLSPAEGDTPLEALVPAGVMASPQGIAPALDRDVVYIADYGKGIFRVDAAAGEAVKLDQPEGTALLGIDGLVRHGNDLIAIQNGTAPQRILRLALTDDGTAITRVEVLAAALPGWDEPTQGVVVGDRLYFTANSQWGAFAEGAPDPAQVEDPRVVWVALP